MSIHRLLRAKNHQLTLWQPCGTWRTISKGVEASHLIERNQRLCCGSNVFGIKCIWIFLSNQPLFLTYASSVYITVKWELSYRGPLLFTSSNKVKSGFSVKKNSHPFVSMCIWGLCPHGYGRQNLLRTVACMTQSLTAEEDLVPCWMASSWGK